MKKTIVMMSMAALAAALFVGCGKKETTAQGTMDSLTSAAKDAAKKADAAKADAAKQAQDAVDAAKK